MNQGRYKGLRIMPQEKVRRDEQVKVKKRKKERKRQRKPQVITPMNRIPHQRQNTPAKI